MYNLSLLFQLCALVHYWIPALMIEIVIPIKLTLVWQYVKDVLWLYIKKVFLYLLKISLCSSHPFGPTYHHSSVCKSTNLGTSMWQHWPVPKSNKQCVTFKQHSVKTKDTRIMNSYDCRQLSTVWYLHMYIISICALKQVHEGQMWCDVLQLNHMTKYSQFN